MLTKLTGVIISQYIHISNNYDILLKYKVIYKNEEEMQLIRRIEI